MNQRMAPHRPHARLNATARDGFTLVEMMVATTLVVMMMLMFAQIYVAAIESLGEQQAVARNDGKARLVDLILQGDLDRISYLSAPNSNQGIVPLVRDDVVQSWQRGFFYLSENDQTNPNDDVLHFTTSIKTSRGRDQSMYYGRARNVTGTLVYGTGASPQFPNHPEIDDGDTGNGVGASRDAEVCYFVRRGNLYRRVLLIRDIDLAGVPGTNAAQPSQGTVDFSGLITPANAVASPSYYKAFDYSAYFRQGASPSVRFLGTDALQNHSVAAINSAESFGCSLTRFGFAITSANQTFTSADLTDQANKRARGTPVEYDSAGNFFGRPLHAETGSYLWRWPGTGTNRLNSTALVYNPTTDVITDGATPIVDPDTTNTRATEDLLLSNVEAFDIEVWDQGLFEDFNQNGVLNAGEDLNGNGFLDQAGGFVQLGNSSPSGYFRAAQRLNSGYGPGVDPTGTNATVTARNWVFDTGHPDMWTEDPARAASFKPPYRPLQYRLAATQAFPVRIAASWAPSTQYVSGAVVFKLDSFNVGDTTFSTAYRCVGSGEDANGNQIVDASENNGTAGTQYGSSGTTAPQWPVVPGQRVTEGETGSQVTWEAFDNRVGLQKIRITVRVRDPKEDLPRQFSIIHSFANPMKSH